MSDRLRQIEVFLKVAETKNFTRAGDIVGLSQPALSLLISQFEEELGLKLFHRTTRNVELTKAGQEFLPNAIRIVQDVENTMDSLKQTAAVLRGSVHVSYLPSLSSSLMADCIQDFSRSFPEIELRVEELTAGPIIDAVATGSSDLGVGIFLEERKIIRFVPMFSDKLVLLCSENSPFASKTSVNWNDITSEPFIFLNVATSVRSLINSACVQNNVILKNAYEVNFMSTAISFVRVNLGMTILPTTALADFSLDGIKTINLVGPELERRIGILQRSDRMLSPAAAQFAKKLKNLTLNSHRFEPQAD